jgi:hypothetical protein
LSLKQEFSGDVYNSHGNSQSRGVSIFIKKELKSTCSADVIFSSPCVLSQVCVHISPNINEFMFFY